MYRRFQVGQVIRLRSGGPKMIVRTLDENALGEPMVDCVWIDQATAERRRAGGRPGGKGAQRGARDRPGRPPAPPRRSGVFTLGIRCRNNPNRIE